MFGSGFAESTASLDLDQIFSSSLEFFTFDRWPYYTNSLDIPETSKLDDVERLLESVDEKNGVDRVVDHRSGNALEKKKIMTQKKGEIEGRTRSEFPSLILPKPSECNARCHLAALR